LIGVGTRLSTFAVVALIAGMTSAQAQPEGSNPPPEVDEGDPSDDEEPEDLRARVVDLEKKLAQTQELILQRRPTVTVGGYVDAGFFAAQGNGSGVVQDVGGIATRYYPNFANRYGWVFLGDLLSPAINSRGEPADLGNLPGVDRFDSVHSQGAPGFIVNEVNLTLSAAVGDNALASSSVNFVPRTGTDFRLGDFVDVDIAQLEWMPTASHRTSIFVGKFESVLGIEYRERKASQRFGITPSLLARYTTGTPIGVKVRSKWGSGDWLVLAAAVTNGSSVIETFHFYDEIDSNAGKTASARISVAATPVLRTIRWAASSRAPPPRVITPIRFELGLSGSYGAQDRALDSKHPLWFAGVDLQVHSGDFDLKGQWLVGRGAGETGDSGDAQHRPYGLRLNSAAYLEANWMVTPVAGLLARGEFRDALVWLGNPETLMGADRLYVTKSWRGTFGARIVPGQHSVIKAEYLRNGEYGGVPTVRNDVFTTSLVLIY
jgi:hypothetical protein